MGNSRDASQLELEFGRKRFLPGKNGDLPKKANRPSPRFPDLALYAPYTPSRIDHDHDGNVVRLLSLTGALITYPHLSLLVIQRKALK